MASEVHVGDIGVEFRATLKDQDAVVVDVSTATTKQLIFRKPNGTVLTKTAANVTDGTNGQIKYVSIAGDLDKVGEWKIQGYVKIGTSEFHSDIRREVVYPNLS